MDLEGQLNFEQAGHTRPGFKVNREGGVWWPGDVGWVSPVDHKLDEFWVRGMLVPNRNCGGGHGKAVMVRGWQLGHSVGPKGTEMEDEAGKVVGLASVCWKIFHLTEGEDRVMKSLLTGALGK